MQISVYKTQKKFPIDAASVHPVVLSVLAGERQQADEVAVHFVGTQKICALHAQFFDDPSPTDCISFPIDDPSTFGYRVLGEVFICPETGFRFLPKDQRHTEKLYEELTLYLVHGLLHLLGYDDIDPGDREVMRKTERFHMQRLKKANSLLKKPLARNE